MILEEKNELNFDDENDDLPLSLIIKNQINQSEELQIEKATQKMTKIPKGTPRQMRMKDKTKTDRKNYSWNKFDSFSGPQEISRQMQKYHAAF